MDALAWLVANCPTFQAVVSARTAEEAYEHVYWPEANDFDPSDPNRIDARPRAIITHTGSRTEERRGPGHWRNEGTYDLSFEFLIPEPYEGNRRDEQRWFDNQWGNILTELKERSGLADSQGRQLFNAHSFMLSGGPGPVAEDEDTEYFYGVMLTVSWPN